MRRETRRSTGLAYCSDRLEKCLSMLCISHVCDYADAGNMAK